MTLRYRLEISDDVLPPAFQHHFVRSDLEEVTLRSNLQCMDDINKWIREFGSLTRTQWNTRHSVPKGTYLVCLKKFICHQSSFMKVDETDNKKGNSKNAACNAKISIRIKSTSRRLKKDPLMKAGLWATICISTLHTHTLKTEKTLRFLQDKYGKLRETFFEYFSENMTVSQARIHHESLLLESGATMMDLSDGSRNPTNNTVSYWYKQWKEIDSGINSGAILVEEVSSEEEIEDESSILNGKLTTNEKRILNNYEYLSKEEVKFSKLPTDERGDVLEVTFAELTDKVNSYNFSFEVKNAVLKFKTRVGKLQTKKQLLQFLTGTDEV